jgi:hypothetical protein
MSKRQWLCLLGVWVMLFLFIGVPSFWHEVIAVISGLIIIFIAYNLPHEENNISNE